MLIDKVKLQIDVTEFRSKHELITTISTLLDELFVPELWEDMNQRERIIGVDEITIRIDGQFVFENQHWIKDEFDEEFFPLSGNTPTQ